MSEPLAPDHLLHPGPAHEDSPVQQGPDG